MSFTSNQVVALAIAFIAALTFLVAIGKLDATVLQAPAAAFVAWLFPSPFKPQVTGGVK